MKTVWKYAIPMHDHFDLNLPAGADPLIVMVQHEAPQMWAMVNPDAPQNEIRHFRLAGTGHLVEDDIKRHVGSFQVFGGELVFHVFEIEARAASVLEIVARTGHPVTAEDTK